MLVQAVVFACVSPRFVSTSREAWMQGAAGFAHVAGGLAWSFTTLAVAAKYRMTSVSAFMILESAFTADRLRSVAPLMALAWRDAA